MSFQVLLIEDDDALRLSLTQTLDLEGIQVVGTNSLAQAKRTIRANYSGIILSDIRMPVQDGFDVLELVQRIDPDLPVIMLTGQADVPMALKAMKNGAFDFLEKPCATDHLITVLQRAAAQRKRILKTRQIEQQLLRNDTAAVNFPGSSAAVTDLRSALRKLANQKVHVHMTGPLGAGKRLAAHTLHSLSAERCEFITINATADLPQLPLGPHNMSLKQIDQLTPQKVENLLAQINGNKDIRLITSTQEDVSENEPVQNLFSALNPVTLPIPPLSQRRKDLPVLFENLVRQAVRTMSGDMPVIPQSIYAEVIAKDWTGNLPELRSFASSVAVGLGTDPNPSNDLTLAEQMDNFERLVLIETLKRCSGKAVDAAKSLGLPRKTFYDRLARHDLKPKDFTRTDIT